MKFLCIPCDEPMRIRATHGPAEGSLTVTFGCPRCGREVAMLTNPAETQLVRALDVRIGPAADAPAADPMRFLRGTLATRNDGLGSEPEASHGAGPACPFAAAAGGAAPEVTWSDAAERRLERVPPFIRPMARASIERFARDRGHRLITEAVMGEARQAMGM
jgi:hypothetical protein